MHEQPGNLGMNIHPAVSIQHGWPDDPILNILNDAVIMIDDAWRILRWNAAAERIYGWMATEVLGRSISDVIPTLHYLDGTTRAAAANYVITRGGWRGMVIQPHRDGHHRYIDAAIQRVMADDGHMMGMVAVNRDVTEQYAATAQATILARVTLALHTDTKPMTDALQTIVRAVAEQVGDGCVLRLRDGLHLVPSVLAHRDVACETMLHMLIHDYPQHLDRGLTAHVLQTAQPCFIPIWNADDRQTQIDAVAWPYSEQYAPHSCIIVPLMSQGRVIGTLSIVRDITPISYTPHDVTLLQEVAHRSTLVIEGCQLRESEQQARRDLETLYAASQAFMQNLRLPSIVEVLVTTLQSRFGGEPIGIFMFNDQDGLHEVGVSPPCHTIRLPRITDQILTTLLQTAQPYLHHDQASSFLRVPAAPAWTAFPILARGCCLGIVQILHGVQTAIRPGDLHFAQALIAHAAVAIDQAQLLADVHESEDQLQRLTHQLVTTQETERAALARELHDGVGQALTGLKLYLESTPLQPITVWRDRIHEATGQVIDILSQVRQLSLDIRPAALEDLGLMVSLQWLLQRVEQQTGVVSALHPYTPIPPLPHAIELALYRVIQEAVNNLVRYANVATAAIYFGVTTTGVSLLIQDHGRGFDVAQVCQMPRGIGLVGMRERIRMLGGTLTIESALGHGTSLTVDVPCRPRGEEVDHADRAG